MKQWKIALITLLLLFFTYHPAVFAHEGEGEATENYLKDVSTNEHDHSVTGEEVTDSHDKDKRSHEEAVISEESSSHDSHETKSTSDNDTHEHTDVTTNQESNVDSDTNSTDSHDDSSSHEVAGEHGTFDGEETGPNIIVLSSFATVNAGFLLIGIWNKWRKRGTNHGIN